MIRIKCTDTNGRMFSLLSEEPAENITQVWIDKQNNARAAFGRAAIIKWSVETAQ